MSPPAWQGPRGLSCRRIAANGGTVIKPAYPEGNLTVAVFGDPAGNVLGVWQLA